MPYQWNGKQVEAPDIRGRAEAAAGELPLARLTLWPHRSLPLRGFAAAIGFLFLMGLIPLVPLIGTRLIWGILAFSLAALAALWWALQASYRRGLGEELLIWSDMLRLTRTDPGGRVRVWEAAPHWVRLELQKEGPVEHYLTLRGEGREVELGAFLTPAERSQLRDDLAFVLGRLKG